MSEGVSITFFVVAIKALAKKHGGREGSVEQIEELRKRLEAVEQWYVTLPKELKETGNE